MSLKQKTILLVDDDEDMLKLLTKILSASGLTVISANNPSDGRELLREEAPHLVLTDLHMEPENGFMFIQSIRREKQFQTLPVLVLSSLNDFASVKKAIALGVNDYVLKPLQPPMLLRKIRKALMNKDFFRWEAPVGEEIEFKLTLPATVTSLGEAGYELTGPFKLTTGKDINMISPELSELQLENVVHRPSPFLKTYKSHGHFRNDISFIGISEALASKIRQFLSKKMI